MADFAKIERAADGAQVLFYKARHDDGRPELRSVTDMNDALVEMAIQFADTDDGLETLERTFSVLGEEAATNFRKVAVDMVEPANG